jgi:hypothetical protein
MLRLGLQGLVSTFLRPAKELLFLLKQWQQKLVEYLATLKGGLYPQKAHLLLLRQPTFEQKWAVR